MGARAAETLLQMISQPSDAQETLSGDVVALEAELRIRKSAAAPPA
jgi:DNA-binding LacI/PurR family transcriptional regulator